MGNPNFSVLHIIHEIYRVNTQLKYHQMVLSNKKPNY